MSLSIPLAGRAAAASGRTPRPCRSERTCAALLALLALTVGDDAWSQTPAELLRGPYLQRGSQSTAILRWRTASPSDSVVALGETPGALSVAVVLPAPTTEHRVEVGGLAADRLYYYSIGSSAGSLAGGDGAHAFRTAPAAGSTRPLRLWAFGDGGLPTAQARAVRDAYLADPGSEATDAWLLLGDNGYYSGTDTELQAGLFTPFAAPLARSFLWPAIGNHDALSSHSPTQTGPYFDSFSLPRQGESGGVASGTEAWYSFDLGDLHLLCLDTADSDLAPGGAMLVWLAEDLIRNERPWVIAYFHHPPYSKGTHDSDNLADSGGRMTSVRTAVLPLLEAFGVALVLSGHSHSYERSFLLSGHYGVSSTLAPSMRLDSGDGDPTGGGAYSRARRAHGGTVYAVVGAVAHAAGGSLDHPAMARSLTFPGSLILEVDRNRLLARYLDETGVERDRFALLHDELFFGGFESGALTRWTPSP